MKPRAALYPFRPACHDGQSIGLRGISRFKYQLWLFGLSAFFTGLAGAVYATNFRAIVPDVFSLTLLPRGLVGALATLRHRPPQRGIPVSAR